MSDDQLRNDMDPVGPDGTPAAPALVSVPVRRPFAFTMSHALMAAAAAIILIAIMGVVAWVVLGAGTFTPQPATPSVPAAGQPGALGTPAMPATPGSTVPTSILPPVPDVDNRDVFTPRNPFEPIPAPVIATAASDEGTSTNDEDANTLVLTGFVTVDGERKATVELGGVEYTVGEDDKIGTSDYQVLEINQSTIVVLYGDERITLSVGTGTSK